MDRRVFLGSVAAGVLAAAGIVGAFEVFGKGGAAPTGTPSPPPPFAWPSFNPTPTPTPTGLPLSFFPPTLTKVPAPHGTIYGLPGKGNLVALTVDDGANSEVVRLYTEFARTTGMRITFFLNGSRPSWTDNAAALKPLVESGQVQLGNHTWSHPDLQKLSSGGIANELSRNHTFITNTYGVDARPFYRPPFGFADSRVRGVASSLGYTTDVMWYGSLSDSGLITVDQLKGFANKWMLAQHIVIGHANYLPVTECFGYLTDLITSRFLHPVTLNDVFSH